MRGEANGDRAMCARAAEKIAAAMQIKDDGRIGMQVGISGLDPFAGEAVAAGAMGRHDAPVRRQLDRYGHLALFSVQAGRNGVEGFPLGRLLDLVAHHP